MHKDKKKLCLSAIELEQAMRIGEMYQAFDTDFYLTFSPIINELNAIFNKALKILLDAKEELEKNQAGQTEKDLIDPTVVSDVNYAEVKAEDIPLPETQNSLVKPVELTNAYEVARLAGFVGNEQEWLESLKGSKGESGPDDSHVVGEEGQLGVSSAGATWVPELGTPSDHDFITSPGGPKFPRNAVPEALATFASPAEPSETEEVVVDPNMRHGLIRPNI
jgi:hypothetical protein